MKTTTFLLLLFFSSFAAFSQSIELHQPSKRLCIGSQNELIFSIKGDFPSDETFNLYFVVNSVPNLLLASSESSPMKFTTDGSYHTLVIESSKTKIKSNIIYVGNYVHDYVRVNYATTKACTGNSVKLDVWPILEYDKIEWLKEGKVIEGANDYSYQATESGSYFVRVTQEGCVSADSLQGHVRVKIGELDNPYITGDTHLPVCEDFGSNLSIDGDLPNLSYQWRINGMDINGANQNNYTAKQSGNFSLKIRQGECEAISNTVKIKVGELTVTDIYLTPSFQVKDNTVEIFEGQEVTIRSIDYLKYSQNSVNFLEGIKYQWQKDDIDISGANDYKYLTKDVGKYRLKITQGKCIAFSKTVFIKKTDKFKVIEFKGFRKEFCEGEEMSGYMYWDRQTYGYNMLCKIYRNNQFFKEVRWYSDFIIKEPGSYHAVASFSLANGSKTFMLLSDTIHVASKNNIINYSMNRPISSSTCLDSLLVNGWEYGANYSPIHQWKLNGVAIPNETKGYIFARETGLYQLETQINKGCAYLSNQVKIEFSKLDVKLSKYFSTCYDSLYLHPNMSSILEYYTYGGVLISKPSSYEWQLNGKIIGHQYNQPFLNEGTYKFILKQGTCVSADSIRIGAGDLKLSIPKTLSPNQDSLFICPNGTASIVAPQGNFTYTWLKNNQLFSNNQTQTIKASAEGTYRVWVENENCGRMSNAIIVKEKIILPTAFISGNKELISGDSTRIKIDLTSLPPWTIKLTNNQEFTANASPFEFAVKPLQTTVYELASVKNDCGVGTVSGKAEIKIIILGNEELTGAKINLYPVPTQGICQLSVETLVPEKLGFQLYNVEGKMLMKSEESKSGRLFNEVINLETMPDGVYVLKIKVGAKVASRKIIKGN